MSLSFNELVCSNSVDRIVAIGIDRPAKANSLTPEIVSELCEAFIQASSKKNIRCVVMFGHHGNFCAGADLEWMKACGQMDREENYQEALKLTHMFDIIANMSIPTLALVKGAVFGGGVGLLAACDMVIADNSTNICLSEARLGIIPSIISQYLLRRVKPVDLIRLTSFATPINSDEAKRIGLVDFVSPDNLMQSLKYNLDLLLACSPDTKVKIKNLIHSLVESTEENKKICAHSIAEARMGGFAQNGLSSFLQKKQPIWHTQVELNELDKIKTLVSKRPS